MNDQDIAPTMRQAQILRMVMDTIAYRVRLWATLILSFSLFAYALAMPADWRIMAIRLGGAIAFTVLVHVPVWRKDKGEAK